ncbi:MAG TPA: MFS transporter [Ilumatobacter sp.]|nr:MFS transporter [Ilumatobacter sp.]
MSAALPGAYWRQWSASAISNLGDGVNFVAIPLLAFSLTDDERLLALTTLATFLPWLVLAIPVGTVVDRLDRQALMVAASVVRIALFSTVAVGAVDGWLSIWLLVILLLVVGSCEVLFDSSAQAFLPMLVDTEQLARANGLLFAAEIVAGSLAGLALGAFLFDASNGLPFAANAASFAVAALLIVTIRVRRSARAPRSDLTDDRRRGAGIAWLRAEPVLVTLAALFTITNLGLMFGQGIFVKYASVELGLDSVEYGILLAITAMGAATGGLAGHRVISRLGLRASVVVPFAVFGPAQVIIGLAPAAWIVGVVGFVLGFAITTWNVATVTVRQRIIPSERFGRVNAVYRWLGAAASAVGIAAGGFVAYATDLRAPFLLGGAITVVAAALFARPVLDGLAPERLA